MDLGRQGKDRSGCTRWNRMAWGEAKRMFDYAEQREMKKNKKNKNKKKKEKHKQKETKKT
jgi:predicted Fe-S protein YdhL (DUF1289 family)